MLFLSLSTLMQTDILTLDELHEYLKIPKPTLYALARAGRLPAAKVGKHWRFRRREINAWLKAQQARPAARRRSLEVTHAG